MQISLNHRAVASLDLSPDESLRLTTRSGTAWVTLGGDSEDHALTASTPLEFTGPGRLVVEALEGDMVIRARIAPGTLREPSLCATA